MPTYDYECDACGHEFELFQSISEPVKRKCPECGKPKLRRLFGTGAAVVFKGSGFYQTDYRSESYKKAAEKEKSSGEGSVKSTSDAAAKKHGEAGAKTEREGKASSKTEGEAKSSSDSAVSGKKKGKRSKP
jgi:putative FmdB family regulatory protein